MTTRVLDGIEFEFEFDIEEEGLKAERVQERFAPLDGWELVHRPSRRSPGKEVPHYIWTAFELADHYEACELVGYLGEVADVNSVRPEIDVRGHVVFLTVKTPKVGLIERDFDFAEAVDRELGNGLKAKSLMAKAS